MYLSDYHTHCSLSFDSETPMSAMVRSAKARGLQEICLTDHVDVYQPDAKERTAFDWENYAREYDTLYADGVIVRRGAELGEATRDFAYAEKLLAEMPPMDFIIGSQHQLSAVYGFDDLCCRKPTDEKMARELIADYLTLLLQLARWGKFSVLGHLTLPLRYYENRGMHMTFDGFEAEVKEVLRALLQNGCGIECNTNRGGMPLPDGKWLKMYRRLGGEVITIGTDAHTPEYVGCHVREVQELLRDCGFTYHCTFEKRKPVFHKL